MTAPFDFQAPRDSPLLGRLPPNVVLLPRRPRSFATWGELLASYAPTYAPRPAEPGKVLAFAPPPREPMP